MRLVEYHKLRTAVQLNAAPGSVQELQSVTGALREGLLSTGLFHDVEAEWTDNNNHLVVAMCTFSEDMSELAVAARLEILWQDRLRYGFWAAHTLIVDRNQVELEAASRVNPQGHYVTLHVVAQKAPIPAQRVSSE